MEVMKKWLVFFSLLMCFVIVIVLVVVVVLFRREVEVIFSLVKFSVICWKLSSVLRWFWEILG